jgi:hypothetical protein
MDSRNKLFRTHCNIDVFLDREENCVSVEVSYKDEFLEVPQCRSRYAYYASDVVEELLRQGIVVGPATKGFHMELDNTSVARKYQFISESLCFPLAVSTDKVAEEEGEEVVSKSPEPQSKTKKRKSRSKPNTK